MRKDILLNNIREELSSLKDSPLYSFREKNNYLPVFGEGDPEADIMLIGEAPGEKEALSGKPFCGKAGKLLDFYLDKVKIKRESVYITNIVKDRPPNNRNPLSEEIDYYAPFLERQIEIIKPKIIATLGTFSSHYILKSFKREDLIEPISKIQGKIIFIKEFKVLPLYHPAAIIYNQKIKEDFENGFFLLKKTAT